MRHIPLAITELTFQANIGKNKVTMVTISGAGEQLSQVLGEYTAHLRERGRAARSST